MGDQLPPITTIRRHKRGLIVSSLLGLIIAAALVGGWAYLRHSQHDRAGLEGTWCDSSNPKHCYEFRPNGELATWSGSKEWWNRIGWSATWRRDGKHIRIQTDRNWDFEGELDGGSIRGKMILRDDKAGAVVNTVDAVWQKE